MRTENFTIESLYDGLPLSCMVYLPEGEAKGIFQIVHGMCEYKERYADFMSYLAENGFIAAAHDHRGHGKSIKTESDLGWFGDKRGRAVVEDAVQVTRKLKEKYPSLPVTLFGHSMGSMVVRCYIADYDDEIDKLIVCGSPSKNPLAGAVIALVKAVALAKGERYRSGTLAQLSTGSGDKKFPGEGKNAWLTRDKEIVERYNADPHCNFIFTCNGFENLFRLMKKTYDKKRYAAKKRRLPIFFVSGSDDPVLIDEDKWLKAQNTLREIGYANVSGKLYHQMRHEILNELGKEEVYADLLAFAVRSAEVY